MFDTPHTYTNAGATTPDVTVESLMEVMKKLQPLVPQVTDEQRRWAKMAGFPDYPGFKVSPDVWRKLRAEFDRGPVPPGALVSPDHIGGIPVAVDDTLPAGTVQSAEKMWEGLQKLRADLMNPEAAMVSLAPRRFPILFTNPW